MRGFLFIETPIYPSKHSIRYPQPYSTDHNEYELNQYNCLHNRIAFTFFSNSFFEINI